LRAYRDLREHLAAHGGGMGLSYKPYLRDLQKACEATGERWSGTHALRHGYIRAFVIAAAAAGLSSKDVMREAMERVGHHRLSELKTYCR